MNIVRLLVFGLFTAHAFGAAYIDPVLRDLIESKVERRIRVLVVLPEIPPMPASVSAAEQILARQREVRRQHKPLLKALAELKGSFMESLWISNTISLEILSSQLPKIAAMGDVLRIEENQEIIQDDPIETKSSPFKLSSHTYGLEQIKALQTWEEFSLKGEGVRVGIIDSGVDSNHPELRGRVIKNRDFIEGYPDDKPNDATGHGTHCAGSMAGANVGDTAIGVAPEARIISAKIFNKSGSSDATTVLKAMQWMVDPDANPSTNDFPRLVSNSWGGKMSSTFHRAVKVWEQLGILPVFAAGNSGPRKESIAAPAGYPESLAVGASKEDGKIANFSSRGPVFYQGKSYQKPDVSAPGYDVLSSRRGGGYQKMSGTSMACPHVAGAAALVFEANPKLNAKMVRRILEVSASDILSQGLDNHSGWGIINVYEAAKLAISGGMLQVAIDPEIEHAYVSVAGWDRTFPFDGEGVSYIPLTGGTHKISVKAYGYRIAQHQLNIEPQSLKKLRLNLVKSPKSNIRIRVYGQNGSSIPARVRILDTPLEIQNSQMGSFDLELPEGQYQIDVLSKGFRKQSKEIQAGSQGTYSFHLVRLPSILLADRSPSHSYEQYYVRALERLNLSYDLVSDDLDADLFEGYALILWFTGNVYQSTITGHQQEVLSRVIHSGGRFILTGQDASFSLRREDFYQKVLGSVMVKDETKQRIMRGLGLELRINGSSGASNQTYPDELNTHFKAKNARILLKWDNGKGAAIFNTYGQGKTANLGFGLEGLNGDEEISALLKALLQELQPPVETRIQKLIHAYQTNRENYKELLRNFLLPSYEQEKARSILQNYLNKGIELPRDLIILIRSENLPNSF